MKKISLRGISEILSEKELKNVVGGSDGTMTGYNCSSGQCYADITWSNGVVECGYPMPMVVCKTFAGFTC